MATINPFYRFEMPPANAGFYPECNRVSQVLSDLYNSISTTIFQFQNVEWTYANIALKNLVNQYNNDFSANFIIVYPTPFPALSGIGYFEVLIYNKQLKSVHPNQVVTIGVDFTDTSVYCTLVNSITILNINASLDEPFVREEQKAISGLGIVEANGFAYFEKPYFWDAANDFAESSLIRCRTWINNSIFNYPTSTSTPSPLALVAQPRIPELTQEAKSVIGLMNSILKAAYEEKTSSELIDIFNAFNANSQFPDGWTATPYSIGSTKLEFTIESADEVIKYVGLEGAFGFKFQRFIGFGTNIGINIIDIDSLSPFPIPPLFPSLKYYSFYYDFDLAELSESCTEPDESYQMPIMPGDELSFLIPQAMANVANLTSVDVGLFTENGEFVQKVGNAVLDIEVTQCTSFTFIVYPVSQYLGFPQNIGFGIGQPPTCPNTIITLDYSFDLNYGGNYPGTAEEWMDAMVAGFPEELGSITYAIVGSGIYGDIYSVTWTLYDSFPAGSIGTWGVVLNSTTMDASTFCNDDFGQQWGEAVDCSLSVCQKFLSANVTIPAKPFGCYRFGLYIADEDEEQYILYSLSNLLKLDWSDCYSTIIEFYGNDNSVNQGFYYATGWKHRVRLGINGGGDKPKIEENIYRQSNGVFKRPSNKLDLTLDLHTDFLDVPTQKALVDATRHDFLIWDAKPIFVTGDIEVATIQDFSTQSSFEKLAQVKFSVLVQNYQPNNSSCFSC